MIEIASTQRARAKHKIAPFGRHHWFHRFPVLIQASGPVHILDIREALQELARFAIEQIRISAFAGVQHEPACLAVLVNVDQHRFWIRVKIP